MARPAGRLACTPCTSGTLVGLSAFQRITKLAPEPPVSSLRGTKIS